MVTKQNRSRLSPFSLQIATKAVTLLLSVVIAIVCAFGESLANPTTRLYSGIYRQSLETASQLFLRQFRWQLSTPPTRPPRKIGQPKRLLLARGDILSRTHFRLRPEFCGQVLLRDKSPG